jgi:hypothetical protein
MGDGNEKKDEKGGLNGAKKTSLGSFVIISESANELEAEYTMFPCTVGIDANKNRKKKDKDGKNHGRDASAGGPGKDDARDSEKGRCGR